MKLVMSVYQVLFGKFHSKHTKSLFQIIPNLFQDILDYLVKKKAAQKKLPKAIMVLKKRGGVGVRKGMIMITDSMGFIKAFP